MQQEERPNKITESRSTSRDTLNIVIAAMLAAVYIAYAILSSYSVGSITKGIDTFVLRSLIFVVLAAFTSRLGLATLSGLISGIVMELVVLTPVRFILLPSVTAYGLVFDIIMNIPSRSVEDLGIVRVLFATILASIAMSGIAIAVFTLVGFFPPFIIPIILLIRTPIDVILGVVGAVIGLALGKSITRLRPQ